MRTFECIEQVTDVGSFKLDAKLLLVNSCFITNSTCEDRLYLIIENIHNEIDFITCHKQWNFKTNNVNRPTMINSIKASFHRKEGFQPTGTVGLICE